MKQEVVTLQDLVQWSVAGALFLLLLATSFKLWAKRKQALKLRKRRRRCSQCGLWQELEAGGPKFGTCPSCGGVTSRGRSRKLG